MFIRTKPISNSSRKRVQICACHRVGDKVKQKVVKHVGISENDTHLEELLKLAKVLKNQMIEQKEGPFLFDMFGEDQEQTPASIPENPHPEIDQKEECASVTVSKIEKDLVDVNALKEESRVVDGFHDVFGPLFNQLGLQRIIKTRHRDVLRDVVLARIACPVSKAATQQILAADFGREIDLDRIYRMMDILIEKKSAVQKAVFTATEQLCFGSVDILLFDVTTLYFESVEQDELREFGYSKDQKFHSTQVVLALATAPNGLPIGYHLFPGNTAETSTLIACVEEWKKTLPIGQVRIVADRAMMSEKNLQTLEQNGIKYVIAAKLRKQSPGMREKITGSPRERDGIVLDELVNERRLVVTFSAERQGKDEKDRIRIIEKMKKKIGKGKAAKKLISNSGYKKYLSGEGEAHLFVDEAKIAQDAMWDGFHGIITNCTDETSEELLSQYKRLWVIEESFRIHKHNLSLRPIYHFKPERIEAHILICYLAFALIRHLELRVKVQHEKISIGEIRRELWRVQSSYLRDTETGKTYRLPSATTPTAKKIYHVMGVKRNPLIQKM